MLEVRRGGGLPGRSDRWERRHGDGFAGVRVNGRMPNMPMEGRGGTRSGGFVVDVSVLFGQSPFLRGQRRGVAGSVFKTPLSRKQATATLAIPWVDSEALCHPAVCVEKEPTCFVCAYLSAPILARQQVTSKKLVTRCVEFQLLGHVTNASRHRSFLSRVGDGRRI